MKKAIFIGLLLLEMTSFLPVKAIIEDPDWFVGLSPEIVRTQEAFYKWKFTLTELREELKKIDAEELQRRERIEREGVSNFFIDEEQKQGYEISRNKLIDRIIKAKKERAKARDAADKCLFSYTGMGVSPKENRSEKIMQFSSKQRQEKRTKNLFEPISNREINGK